MSDYASTGPLQPIVNLVLNPIVAGFFVGQGVLSVVRTPGGAPAGDFTIVLDPGLPGDVGLDGAFGRVTITQRGTLGTLAGGTTITSSSVTYPSQTTVRVVFEDITATPVDPAATEILIWRAN
jgi:hypothetical protein